MTITVEGPDGSSFDFPDGTTQDVIMGMVQKHYGVTPSSSAPSPDDPRFSGGANAAAETLRVPMPLGSLLHDRFLRLLAEGGERLDWAAIGGLAARDAGKELDRTGSAT